MTANNDSYLTQLHQLLNQYFDLEEFRSLCFDLNVDYDSLRGEGKSARIRELLLLLGRSNRLTELVTLARQKRSLIDWPSVPDNFELPNLSPQVNKLSGGEVGGNVINTDGGAYVGGNVVTGDGDFIGRDQILHKADEEMIDIEQLEKQPYIVNVTKEGSTFGAVYTAGGLFIGRDLIINNFEVKDIEHLRPDPCEPPCAPPYQGLLNFGVDDTDRFFGRDNLTAEIVGRLCNTNFLTVMGASGSGKSSVVRAGVVPAMQGRKNLDALNELALGYWQEIIMTPTAWPLAKIAEMLFPHEEVAQNQLQRQLQQTEKALADSINQLITTDKKHRVLVVDQFEELFTLCSDKVARQAFINNLLYIANNQQPSLKIIVVLRADFYHHCLQYKNLAHLVIENQMTVLQMESEELAEAILWPAAMGQWKLQASLIDQMLDDIGQEPGALPLLSHALLETWNRRRLRVMTLSGYREAGSIKGAIAQTAETIFTNLTENEQLLAKSLFLRLTEPGPEEALDTRRKVRFDEIDEDSATQRVWHKLTQARLITADEVGLEVAHETLIRKWPRLRQWLNTNRKGLIIHHGLINAAQTWEEKGEESSYLYSGSRLEEAEQWAKSNSENLNALEQIFLEASLLADKQRKRNRRYLQVGVTIGVSILVILSIATAMINNARNSAITAQETAEAAQATSDVNANEASFQAGEANIARSTSEAAAIIESEARTTAVVAQSTAEANENRALVAEATAIVLQDQTEQQRQITSLLAQSQALMDVRSPDNQAVARARLMAVAATQIDRETSGQNSSLLIPWSYDLTRAIPAPYQPLTTLLGHTDVVGNISWSADGSRLASASYDGTVAIWQADESQSDSWQIITSLTGHRGAVKSVAWNGDDSRLASAGGIVTIWDTDSWQPITTLANSNSEFGFSSVAWNMDGSYLASASADNITIWDTATWQPLQTLTYQDDMLDNLAWSNDGDYLASTSSNNIIIWDISSWQSFAISSDNLDTVESLAWNFNHAYLASTSGNNIIIWETSSWQQLITLTDHSASVTSVAWSGDGKLLASASTDRTIILWDIISWQPLTALAENADIVLDVAWKNDNHRLASAYWDGSIIVWDTTSWQPLVTLANHTDSVTTVAWSEDDSQIASASWDNSINVWDTTSWQLQVTLTESAPFTDLDWNNDGSLLASALQDSRVIIWDTTSWQVLTTLSGPMFSFSDVKWAPNSNRLAAIAYNDIMIWETNSWQLLTTLTAHSDMIGSIAWSNDGQFFVSGSCKTSGEFCIQGELAVWDTTNWQPHTILTEHNNWITHVAWSSDSSRLASASQDGTIIIWDTAGWQAITTLNDHTSVINSLAWNDDGSYLASAALDQSVVIWDTTSWRPLLTLTDHTDEVTSVAWSNNGHRLASAAADGIVNITKIEDLDARNCDAAYRNFSWEEWQNLFPTEPYHIICPQWSIHPTVPLEARPGS